MWSVSSGMYKLIICKKKKKKNENDYENNICYFRWTLHELDTFVLFKEMIWVAQWVR